MSEQHPGATACTLTGLPDYTGVQIVALPPEATPADFPEAMKLAVAIAEERVGAHMLLSWYDGDRNFEAPQHTSECDRPGAIPGYVDYGLSHGAQLKVDIGQGRFVFFFLPLADAMA